MMTHEQLANVFAALTPSTRTLIKKELEAALRDTSVEYHRQSDRGAQVMLAKEVESLTKILMVIDKVDKEFEEVSG